MFLITEKESRKEGDNNTHISPIDLSMKEDLNLDLSGETCYSTYLCNPKCSGDFF